MTPHIAKKACIAGLSATLATGCTSLPDWSLFGPLHTVSVASSEASYDFSWRLSGDQRAGPLQVFDDGHTTWLQFAPNQAVPAIFARLEEGDRLLSHRVHGPYVVLDGVWPLLILRAGKLQSQAQRISDDRPTSVSGNEIATDTATAAELGTSVAEPMASAVDDTASPAAQSSPLPSGNAQSPMLSIPFSPPVATALSPDIRQEAKPMLQYQVSPEDGNLRRALSRWARTAGWTFEAEHWAVDVDIPVSGTAVFDLEFDEAVQQLLASTELSERPLQPCFYANKVLRVVSYAQSCDRSAPLERA